MRILFWRRPPDPLVRNEQHICDRCIHQTTEDSLAIFRICKRFSESYIDLITGQRFFTKTTSCVDARLADGPCKPAGLFYSSRNDWW